MKTLFDMPVEEKLNLGPCARSGCKEPATLASPSGNPQSIYCEKHGHCGHYYIDRQTFCGISVEHFVLYEALGIWCCPCVKGFKKG